MSIELYANAATTTISEDLDDSEVGVDVASAALFPTTGNFRVLVDNELMIVTGVSGTTFTVVRGAEGTTPASHSSGATLTQVLTRDSHRALFSQIYGCSFRQAPVSADFAWINQGTATATDLAYGISLKAAKAAGPNLHILKKSAPSTPYTISAVFRALQHNGNYSSVGLLFRQSSDGKLHSFARVASGAYYSTKWTDATTFNADYANWSTPGSMDPIILRIADDGTYRKCSLSADGTTWTEVHSVGRTDFLTADEVGVFIHQQQNDWDTTLQLMAWEQA